MTPGSFATSAPLLGAERGVVGQERGGRDARGDDASGTARSVRRAPAQPAAATPTVTPARTPRSSHAFHRARSSARAHIHAAVIAAAAPARSEPTTDPGVRKGGRLTRPGVACPALTAYRRRVSVAWPLSGVQVVDLSSGLAGAYCAKLLADGGADVVKVEDADR